MTNGWMAKVPSPVRLVQPMPVSLRTEEERGMLGNRLAVFRAPLPVYAEDPVERLRIVREEMSKVKQSKQVMGAQAIVGLNDFAPPRTSSPPPARPSPSAPGPSWPPPDRAREDAPSRLRTTSHPGSSRSPGSSPRARPTRKPPPSCTSAQRPSTTTSAACSENSASNPAGSCSTAHSRLPKSGRP